MKYRPTVFLSGLALCALATFLLRAEADIKEASDKTADAPGAAKAELLWKLDLKSPSYGSGAIADIDGDGDLDIVFGTYFGDEHIHAVRAKDGKELWKFKSDRGPFDASVAIADLDGDKKLEILAADSSSGSLFCLSGQGKEMWKFKLPNSTDSPPAVADLDGDGKVEIVIGTMWMADKNGRVLVIDPATRKEKWQAKIPGCVQSEPVLIDLNGDKHLDVIVTSWKGDKSVHALNGKTGEELWKHTMKGEMYHGVSLVPGKETCIVVGSTAGDVTLLDIRGKEKWTKDVGGSHFAPTTVADLDGDGTCEIIAATDRITVLDLEGKEKWKSEAWKAGYGIQRGAAVADADGDGKLDVIFGAGDRKFRVLRGLDGKELFCFDSKVQDHAFERIGSAPLVADFEGNGNLSVFFVTGKGTYDPKARAGSKDNYGRAFAVRLGKGKGSWETFRGNLRRTGNPGPGNHTSRGEQ